MRPNTRFSFGKDSGQLDAISFGDGANILKDSSAPAFWRAPTDNDLGGSYQKRRGMWQYASRDRMIMDNECRLVSGTNGKAAVYSSLAKLQMVSVK